MRSSETADRNGHAATHLRTKLLHTCEIPTVSACTQAKSMGRREVWNSSGWTHSSTAFKA